ncbi:MAG: NfeD family protein [Clostridia bacterium]|nr:NfeD family protein [Clostridia bacterium]
MWVIWLILCGVFLLIEIFTVSFLMFWPGIGAFLAFITSLITDNEVIQVAVFVVSTTLMIIFMKPLVKKLFKNKDNTKMNNDSIIGKNGVVVKDIDPLNSTGQVKVNGELWSAFTEEKKITSGTTVSVLSIEGVKLKVKKV